MSSGMHVHVLCSNNCPFASGIWAPCNTYFLGLTRVHNPNGISIGSAVVAGLTTVTDRQTDRQTTTTTVLRPFFWDHPDEPVPEENFWTLWCKGRLTEADTLTIQIPDGCHSIWTSNQCPPPPSPMFFTGRMPFLPPNQQRQSTKGN